MVKVDVDSFFETRLKKKNKNHKVKPEQTLELIEISVPHVRGVAESIGEHEEMKTEQNSSLYPKTLYWIFCHEETTKLPIKIAAGSPQLSHDDVYRFLLFSASLAELKKIFDLCVLMSGALWDDAMKTQADICHHERNLKLDSHPPLSSLPEMKIEFFGVQIGLWRVGLENVSGGIIATMTSASPYKSNVADVKKVFTLAGPDYCNDVYQRLKKQREQVILLRRDTPRVLPL